jgi:hypothetical protein
VTRGREATCRGAILHTVRRRRVLGLLVLTVAALFSATSVASAGGALTAKQWRKKANAVCARGDRASLAIQEESFGDLQRDEQPSLEQMTSYVDGIEPIVGDIADGIAALREPKALEPKVKQLVRALRRDLARLVDDPSIGLEGNPFSGFTTRAEALDLSSCS